MINIQDIQSEYIADGTNKVFDFSFKVFEISDLFVEVNSVLSDVYDPVLENDTGGTITFTHAPAAGAKILIYRKTPITQNADFQNGEPLRVEAIEVALDRNTAILQEIAGGEYDGDAGAKGDKGNKGDKGDTGLTGLKGDKGDQGNRGLQGETGDQGIQGIRGTDGDQGINGRNGRDGGKGDRGDNGTNGTKGDKGDKGDNGSDGQRGLQGVRGVDGADGSPGSDGVKGDKGDAGADGSAGTDGTDGTDGINGSNGVKGDKGDQGDQGERGLQGIQGIPGTGGTGGGTGTPLTSILITPSISNSIRRYTIPDTVASVSIELRITNGANFLINIPRPALKSGIFATDTQNPTQYDEGRAVAVRVTADGDNVFGITTSSSFSSLNIRAVYTLSGEGSAGADGEQGIQGERGERGLQGADGSDGRNGSNGRNGTNGSKGDKGDKGDGGVRGATGLQGIQGLQGIPGDDATGSEFNFTHQTLDLGDVTKTANITGNGDGSTPQGFVEARTESIRGLAELQGNTNVILTGNIAITYSVEGGSAPVWRLGTGTFFTPEYFPELPSGGRFALKLLPTSFQLGSVNIQLHWVNRGFTSSAQVKLTDLKLVETGAEYTVIDEYHRNTPSAFSLENQKAIIENNTGITEAKAKASANAQHISINSERITELENVPPAEIPGNEVLEHLRLDPNGTITDSAFLTRLKSLEGLQSLTVSLNNRFDDSDDNVVSTQPDLDNTLALVDYTNLPTAEVDILRLYKGGNVFSKLLTINERGEIVYHKRIEATTRRETQHIRERGHYTDFVTFGPPLTANTEIALQDNLPPLGTSIKVRVVAFANGRQEQDNTIGFEFIDGNSATDTYTVAGESHKMKAIVQNGIIELQFTHGNTGGSLVDRGLYYHVYVTYEANVDVPARDGETIVGNAAYPFLVYEDQTVLSIITDAGNELLNPTAVGGAGEIRLVITDHITNTWTLGGVPSYSKPLLLELYGNKNQDGLGLFDSEGATIISDIGIEFPGQATEGGGERGATGLKGDTGDKGDKGDRGIRGTDGTDGSKGDKGDRGYRGVNGSDGQRGARGLQGDRGERGLQGEAGTGSGGIQLSGLKYTAWDTESLTSSGVLYGWGLPDSSVVVTRSARVNPGRVWEIRTVYRTIL